MAWKACWEALTEATAPRILAIATEVGHSPGYQGTAANDSK